MGKAARELDAFFPRTGLPGDPRGVSLRRARLRRLVTRPAHEGVRRVKPGLGRVVDVGGVLVVTYCISNIGVCLLERLG